MNQTKIIIGIVLILATLLTLRLAGVFFTTAIPSVVQVDNTTVSVDNIMPRVENARSSLWGKEITDCSSEIKQSPDNTVLYRTRGWYYLASANYYRAITDFNTAIVLDPKNTWVYNNRGLAYYKKGD